MKMYDLLQALADKNLKLGAVESLTGGLFGAEVCAIPGASAVYKGGIVSYSAEIKESLVGVKPSTIQTYGVVSSQVAAEMAMGGAKALNVDVCVSCTGNAGPSSEPGQAHVGQVYLAVYYQDNVWSIPLDFEGERNEIRRKTVDAMVAFLGSIFVSQQNN